MDLLYFMNCKSYNKMQRDCKPRCTNKYNCIKINKQAANQMICCLFIYFIFIKIRI